MSYLDAYKHLANIWKKDSYKKDEVEVMFKDCLNNWMNTNMTHILVDLKTMRIKDKVQCFVMSLERKNNCWYMLDAHFTDLSVSNMYGVAFEHHLETMYRRYASELLENELYE
jgi:hypothetical protein